MSHRFEYPLVTCAILVWGIFTFIFPVLGILFLIGASISYTRSHKEAGQLAMPLEKSGASQQILTILSSHEINNLPAVIWIDTQKKKHLLIQQILGSQYLYFPKEWQEAVPESTTELTSVLIPQIGAYKAKQHAAWRRILTAFGRLIPWLGNALFESEIRTAYQLVNQVYPKENFDPHWGASLYARTVFNWSKENLSPLTHQLISKLKYLSTPQAEEGIGKGFLFIAIGLLWLGYIGKFAGSVLYQIAFSHQIFTPFLLVIRWGPVLVFLAMGIRYVIKYKGLTQEAKISFSLTLNSQENMEVV